MSKITAEAGEGKPRFSDGDLAEIIAALPPLLPGIDDQGLAAALQTWLGRWHGAASQNAQWRAEQQATRARADSLATHLREALAVLSEMQRHGETGPLHGRLWSWPDHRSWTLLGEPPEAAINDIKAFASVLPRMVESAERYSGDMRSKRGRPADTAMLEALAELAWIFRQATAARTTVTRGERARSGPWLDFASNVARRTWQRAPAALIEQAGRKAEK